MLSLLYVVGGVVTASPALIAFGAGFVVVAKNPFRYRVLVNVALIFNLLWIIRYLFFRGMIIEVILFHFLSFLLLVFFYPSSYPLWMNITAFLFSTESNVNFIERHPGLFRFFSKKSLIGSLSGLYYSSQSFNIILEQGFLGFSPAQDIIAIATNAGVTSGMRGLDIGSGLGGPACAISSELKVDVTGIDLLPWNVKRANELARKRGLGKRVRFVQGNGMSLPFRDNIFDFVFGSDAWCHVPKRGAMLSEIARVLKNGGSVFFYDWLDTGGVSEGFRFIYAFPPLETLEGYKEMLAGAGFKIMRAEYDTEHYVKHVEKVFESVKTNKRRIIEECGRELYDNWLIVVRYTLKMLYEKKLGHGVFIARKP